jgi:RNA polymerase sigma factor (TIGR02999 family)
VHEAYLRLLGGEANRCWNSRGHFFAAAAEAMRRILSENARRKKRAKHGGGRQRQALPPDLAATPADNDELLALDAALTRFAERYPVQAELVKLRYFVGVSGDEAARALARRLAELGRDRRRPSSRGIDEACVTTCPCRPCPSCGP